jgi:hypothetical protein
MKIRYKGHCFSWPIGWKQPHCWMISYVGIELCRSCQNHHLINADLNYTQKCYLGVLDLLSCLEYENFKQDPKSCQSTHVEHEDKVCQWREKEMKQTGCVQEIAG